MEHINNEPKQVEIRRLQDNLTIVGSEIILFSIWTAVKMLGSVFMLRDETVAAVRDVSDLIDDVPDDVLFYFLIFFIVIAFMFDILLRSYIGLSAMREGRGTRKRNGIAYLVIAIGFGRVDGAVYVYGVGLIYSAVLRIASAFKRTDVVYIQ